MASAYNNRLGLPPPFPSFPVGPGSNFGLFIRYGDSKLNFFNFHSAYAGKHALNMIIGDSTIRWLNDDEILIEDTGVRIRGERPGQLDTLIEKKLSPAEREFEMPEPYATWFRVLSGEVKANIVKAPPELATRKTRAAKTTDKPTVPKVARPDGLISIGDIASKLGKPARECRAALRKLKIDKPAHGNWAWAAKEAEEISAKLQKELR